MPRYRRLVVAVLLAASLSGGLITGREFFYTLTYFWAGLLIFSLAVALSGIYGLRLTRHTRARRAQVGRPLEERFSLRSNSPIPKLWIEVRDHSDLPGHHASIVVEALAPRRERIWVVRTLCRFRGRWTLGPVTLTAGEPFGLFQFSRRLADTRSLVVYPAALPLPHFALPVGLMPGGEALRRRTPFLTPNASTVREYAQGDALSRIHWKSTARRGRLIVKEFELDPLSDLWIFLDGYEGARAADEEVLSQLDIDLPLWAVPAQIELPPDTEEYCVTTAATLAQHFIRRGRAVGFAAYGQSREVVQADRGERQLTKLLETLAVLRAAGDLRLDQVLMLEGEQLARGTTVLVVTASPDQRWPIVARSLQRRGLRVVGMLIDPEGFGGPPGMPVTAEILRAAGIPAYLISRDDNIAAALMTSSPVQSRAGVGG